MSTYEGKHTIFGLLVMELILTEAQKEQEILKKWILVCFCGDKGVYILYPPLPQ
jgi:hypothetical protein